MSNSGAESSSSDPRNVPAGHAEMISVIVIAGEAGGTIARIREVEAGLGGLAHEIVVIYSGETEGVVHAMEAASGLGRGLRLIKSEDRTEGGELRAGIRGVAGDVVVVMGGSGGVEAVAGLAAVVRAGHAVAVADEPKGKGAKGRANFLIGAVTGVGTWEAVTGAKAFAADFVEGRYWQASSVEGLMLEMLMHAQMEELPIGVVRTGAAMERVGGAMGVDVFGAAFRRALQAPLLVWGLWLFLIVVGMPASFSRGHVAGEGWGLVANIAMPAAGAFAFILAVRRVRGRTRIADGFYPLVLLNPILIARAGGAFDHTLMSAGLLGLMAGAIIAMKRDHYVRYLAVMVLALLLTRVSDSFIAVLPALIAWLIFAGIGLARAKAGRDRVRGFAVLAAAEVALIVFGLACILIAPTTPPPAATLFSAVVGFSEFPLLVVAIVMLALGWRRGVPTGGNGVKTAPYFWGMLALLVGMLTMVLSNFQPGRLLAPAADQTVLILCLLYTVSALHGPRRLHYLLPPLLLVGAAAYTLMR